MQESDEDGAEGRTDNGVDGLVDGLPDGDDGWEYLDDTSDFHGDEPDETETADEAEDEEPQPTKATIAEFVRRADSRITSGFSDGDVWRRDGPDEGFVELGWLDDDGELTEKGASVLCYAGDIVDEAGGEEAAISGYLNSQGADTFLCRAYERGSDDTGDDGGFLGGLLGS